MTLAPPSAAALAVLLVCAPGASAAAGDEPGTLSGERLDTGDTYTLSLPAGHPPATRAPLVVSLHYGGPVTPHYGAALLESVVEPALRPLGAVMVAPDCRLPAWVDCAPLVLRLLDHVLGAYAVDPGRVLLTGYSKGGTGTWELALRYPERFSAAVPMAGRPRPEMAEARWSVPLYAINGGADELFPPQPTADVVSRLRARGVDATLTVLDGVTHYEVPRFREPLRRAVPWVLERWRR